MPPEPSLTNTQRLLLHQALSDLNHARDRIKGIRLLERYAGQPKLIAAATEIDAHLKRLWHLVDGLDPKSVAPAAEAQ